MAGFRETLSQVAAAVAVPPPDSLKAGVMADIGSTRQLSPLLPDSVIDLASHRQRRQRLMRSVVAAAAVVLLAVGAFVVGRQSSDGSDYGETAAAVLDRPDTRISTLASTEAGTGTGSFKVAWSPSSSEIVVMGDGLADPGPGKAYELWLIDDAGAHAVRLLDKADDQQVRRVLKVDGSPTQWAITVEPEAGVEKATGEIIFVAPA